MLGADALPGLLKGGPVVARERLVILLQSLFLRVGIVRVVVAEVTGRSVRSAAFAALVPFDPEVKDVLL